jgi:DNA-binding transcriptional ArsR family regulator
MMSEHPGHKASDRPRRAGKYPGRLLSEETVDSLVAMLRVLADPTRIRLIEALNEAGRATVSALAARLPLSQQGVSHQLGVLYQAGIVRRRREGVWVQYELCDWTSWWLIEQLAGGLEDAEA